MRVLADHCVPTAIIEAMRAAGVRVDRVVDIADPRSSDRDVARLAVRIGAVLVTADTDFLARASFDPRRCGGIVVMKDLGHAADRVVRRLLRALSRRDLAGLLVVLDARSSRSRR